MPYGPGRRLRNFCASFREKVENQLGLCPEVQQALALLESAVQEYWPSKLPVQGPGRPTATFQSRIKCLRAKLKWARRAGRKAKTELQAAKVAKDSSHHNRTTPEFLAKVALAWPTTCARSFATSWRDLVGVGSAGCSRASITRIRDAFAEVARDMCAHECRQAIQSAYYKPGSAAKAPGSVAVAPASAAMAFA